jgi:hypothetical protein
MRLIGCDLHASQQSIAMLDRDTGVVVEKTLTHEGGVVRAFYASIPAPIVVGIEATGSMGWFLRLMEELAIECRVGHPTAIRKAETRRQKHDRRDAALLLQLLAEDRFPAIWMPSTEDRDLRSLLLHRHQWVRMRTRVQNALHAIVLAHGVRRGHTLWNREGQALHWKAHNEAPKAPMSERAIATDLRGEWYTKRDALEGIRETVAILNEKRPSWWAPRPEKVIEKAAYVVSASEDEWANEILNLDQLTVDGFRASALRSRAAGLGRTGLEKLASLKLIEECLMGLGWEEERAREVTSPFHELHYMRSRVKAHDAGSDATSIRKNVLKQHKTYVGHFGDLCGRCDDALETVAKALLPIG